MASLCRQVTTKQAAVQGVGCGQQGGTWVSQCPCASACDHGHIALLCSQSEANQADNRKTKKPAQGQAGLEGSQEGGLQAPPLTRARTDVHAMDVITSPHIGEGCLSHVLGAGS